MIEELKSIKSGKSDLRQFGISIGIILMIIAGFLFWKEKDTFQIFLTCGIVLCVLGVVIPIILKPIYLPWMIFATFLGWIMTRLILSLLFYIIFTLIGVILRLFGKQFLELKWNRQNNTYWNYRSVKPERESYEKQF